MSATSLPSSARAHDRSAAPLVIGWGTRGAGLGGRVHPADHGSAGCTAWVLTARSTWKRVAATPAGRAVLALLPLLEPAWWVLRAYLLLVAVALLVGKGPRAALLLDVGFFGIGSRVVLAGAIAGSVALAHRRLEPAQRDLLRIGEVVLGLGTILALVALSRGCDVQHVHADSGPPQAQASGAYPLLSPAGPVTDTSRTPPTASPCPGCCCSTRTAARCASASRSGGPTAAAGGSTRPSRRTACRSTSAVRSSTCCPGGRSRETCPPRGSARSSDPDPTCRCRSSRRSARPRGKHLPGPASPAPASPAPASPAPGSEAPGGPAGLPAPPLPSTSPTP